MADRSRGLPRFTEIRDHEGRLVATLSGVRGALKLRNRNGRLVLIMDGGVSADERAAAYVAKHPEEFPVATDDREEALCRIPDPQEP